MASFSRLHLKLTDAVSGLRIVGEVQDADYKEQIQITKMSWDMKREQDKSSTGGRTRAEPGEFKFSKLMDRASTQMLIKMRHGVRLNALVTLDSQDQADFYLTLTLKDARLTGYDLSVTDDEKRGEVTENWNLNYSEILVEYMPSPKETLTTSHKKTKESLAQQDLDAVLDAFASLKPAKQVDVGGKLKKKYPDIFK